MRTQAKNSSTETVPLADLAAEAANEGAPAQSLPEFVPDARRGDNRAKNRNPRAKPAPATRRPQ